MKRIAAILLMIFYMIPAMGFSITTHFCAGELASVSFYSTDGGKCICGAEKMGSGCCSSKTTIVKIKDTQSKDATFEISFIKSLTKPLHSYLVPITITPSVSKTDFSLFRVPPDISKDDPIYILNGVFRI